MTPLQAKLLLGVAENKSTRELARLIKPFRCSHPLFDKTAVVGSVLSSMIKYGYITRKVNSAHRIEYTAPTWGF